MQYNSSPIDKVTNEEIQARDAYLTALRAEDPSHDVALTKIGDRL